MLKSLNGYKTYQIVYNLFGEISFKKTTFYKLKLTYT